MKTKNTSFEFTLGIDISKADYHVALMSVEKSKIMAQKTFLNNTSGHKELLKWLEQKTSKQLPVHLCMEATGSYGDGVAFFFSRLVAKLSVVNPRAIKAYGDSDLRRCKSDPADARLIAKFCLEKKPSAWIEPTPEQRKLKAISRRLSNLRKSLSQENNRLELVSDVDVKKDLKEHIRWIKNHIAKLEATLLELTKKDKKTAQEHRLVITIPGLGDKSAAHILAEIGDISIYSNARQLAAHAGVTPAIFETGKSGRKCTPMTKAGNAHIRKMLFFPAMSAMKYNPICKEFAERLEAKGKPKIVILGAVMNKLLHLIFGVLKHQKPFNPEHLKKC